MNKESKPVAAEAETLPCTHPFLETLAELATWCFLTFGVVACLLFWMSCSPLHRRTGLVRC